MKKGLSIVLIAVVLLMAGCSKEGVTITNNVDYTSEEEFSINISSLKEYQVLSDVKEMKMSLVYKMNFKSHVEDVENCELTMTYDGETFQGEAINELIKKLSVTEDQLNKYKLFNPLFEYEQAYYNDSAKTINGDLIINDTSLLSKLVVNVESKKVSLTANIDDEVTEKIRVKSLAIDNKLPANVMDSFLMTVTDFEVLSDVTFVSATGVEFKNNFSKNALVIYVDVTPIGDRLVLPQMTVHADLGNQFWPSAWTHLPVRAKIKGYEDGLTGKDIEERTQGYIVLYGLEQFPSSLDVIDYFSLQSDDDLNEDGSHKYYFEYGQENY